VEILRFYIDFVKYCIDLKEANLNCELCFENKSKYYFWKSENNIKYGYYICKFCLKAKVIELFNNLTKGYFNSIKLLTNRHYITVKRIKYNSYCNSCKEKIEFEISKYKLKNYYLCTDCLKKELIEIKDYIMVLISVKK
jgi:protein-arginine kinase activator protein McsA